MELNRKGNRTGTDLYLRQGKLSGRNALVKFSGRSYLCSCLLQRTPEHCQGPIDIWVDSQDHCVGAKDKRNRAFIRHQERIQLLVYFRVSSFELSVTDMKDNQKFMKVDKLKQLESIKNHLVTTKCQTST
jgi:hypothetical protein